MSDTRTSEAAESANYNERTVAFIDILGFADLVVRADRDGKLRDQIITALGKVRSVGSPGAGNSDLRTQNFSDSLILSAKATAEGFWHLLLSIDALAWNLLQIGVLIRGGVTIGNLHHDENIVFGVGINNAYRLESTVAKVPRVALGTRAILAAREFATQDQVWKAYKDSRLLRDGDGVWYLNYLCDLAVFNRQDSTNPDMRRHPLFVVGDEIRGIIQEKVGSTLETPDVYAKVDWLGRYWNNEVVGSGRASNSSTLGPIILAGQEPRETQLPFRTY